MPRKQKHDIEIWTTGKNPKLVAYMSGTLLRSWNGRELSVDRIAGEEYGKRLVKANCRITIKKSN